MRMKRAVPRQIAAHTSTSRFGQPPKGEHEACGRSLNLAFWRSSNVAFLGVGFFLKFNGQLIKGAVPPACRATKHDYWRDRFS